MEVVLRPNITIKNPQGIILRYYATMGKGVHAYDQTTLPKDNNFPSVQLKDVAHLVNRLGARIPYSAIDILVGRISDIDKRLSYVPAHVSLLADPSVIPWTSLEELINLFRLPHLSLTGLTKMLHKKRPDIIPILDSVMTDYLQPFISIEAMREATDGQKALEYIKEVKKNIEANRKALIDLQEWDGKPYPVSLIRIFDILVWCTHSRYQTRFADLA